MTLALLLTAVTGAWAQDTYTITFSANGKNKTYTDVVLPAEYKCEYGSPGEFDNIIQELYEQDGGHCIENATPTVTGTDAITPGLDGPNNYAMITITAPFTGKATVSGTYAGWSNNSGNSNINYSIEVYFGTPSSDDAIEVTTNAASEQDLFTEAWFNMPASDVTVNYTLVRDMQNATNPVAFTGLPTTTTAPIIVKKGSDGKYQPAEALTIQLIDPLAAEDAQNIIAADGITVKVLVGNGGTPIEYDQVNPITLEDFLADMKPGYYWIKAEPTDENSPYDGTVYSSEFTVVEQYDLTVKPANDFSKGKIESVTVGTESVTIDATTGEAAKTGIAPNTEVKIKAKRGYVIDKAEGKKTVNMLYIEASNHKLYYMEGETWRQAINNHTDLNQGWQYGGMEVWFGNIVNVLKGNGAAVDPGSVIDPTKTYTL